MKVQPPTFEFKLDHHLPRPLYLQLRDAIVAKIRRGVLLPGAAIPSISVLEATANASRVTIVRALNRLVEDGFIFPQRGKGYYVASRGSKSLLAVVAPFDFRTIHYSSQLLAGVELASDPAGYDVMEVSGGLTEEEFEPAVRQALIERGARSMIVVPPVGAGPRMAKFLQNLPADRLVVADRDLSSSLPTLKQDRLAAYQLLAQHLRTIGCLKIAAVGFGEEYGLLLRALTDAGLKPMNEQLTGQESPEEITEKCDALCCADDVVAVNIHHRMRDAQGRLPFALTGYNHTAHGRTIPGGLTTIDPGLVEMGIRAVQCLSQSGKQNTNEILIAPHLVIGSTTRR